MTRPIHLTCTALAFAAAAFPGLAEAADLQVPADYRTIQAAISASQDGDRVLVAPGSYRENIDFLGHNVQLIGTGGAAVTQIDGGFAGPVVDFQGGEKTALLMGFTLTNGLAQRGSNGGGGIVIAGGATPTIERNVIFWNKAPYGNGGGIWISAAGGRIRNNVFESNTASINGGGIFLQGGTIPVTVEGNAFKHNVADNGGALFEEGARDVTISRNVMAYNVGERAAGAIMTRGGSVVISDNLMFHNFAVSGGIAVDLASSQETDNIRFVNNTIEGNRGYQANLQLVTPGRMTIANDIIVGGDSFPVLNCVTDGDPRARFSHNLMYTTRHAEIVVGNCPVADGGLIEANPRFSGVRGARGYELTARSPAVDAGSNEKSHGIRLDLSGKARVVHGVVDLGAYEFVGGPATP